MVKGPTPTTTTNFPHFRLTRLQISLPRTRHHYHFNKSSFTFWKLLFSGKRIFTPSGVSRINSFTIWHKFLLFFEKVLLYLQHQNYHVGHFWPTRVCQPPFIIIAGPTFPVTFNHLWGCTTHQNFPVNLPVIRECKSRTLVLCFRLWTSSVSVVMRMYSSKSK